MSIAEKFASMEYGPAPEDPKGSGRMAGAPRTPLSDSSSMERGRARRRANTSTRLIHRLVKSWPASRKASQADVDAAVHAARAASSKWRALTPHVRARYLYALARLVQKHSRLLAVLETMDNGKPIRESRDIDIPLVARHFYYHAGWAQLARAGVSRARALRRCRSDHSLELSAAHARVEDCSSSGCWKHGCTEARRVHSAHGARLRRTLRGGWSARRRCEHRYWRWIAPEKRWSSIPMSTRSRSPDRPKLGARFAERPPPVTSGCRSNSEESLRSSSSKMPTSTARSKDWSTESGSTKGKFAVPARAC